MFSSEKIFAVLLREQRRGIVSVPAVRQQSDDYFTFVLHENHYAAFEENPGMTMEETDSVSVVAENGLLRSTTNTGMYANWNDGEEKVWQRFSGTYAASYDADGILTQTDAYHRVGPSGTENKFALTKENGSVVEVVRLWKDYATGKWTGETKFEFEYTDIETTPARFAAIRLELIALIS